MKVYADPSGIVSAFTDEVSSIVVRAWLGSLAVDELILSKWCETEIASAFTQKVRARLLSQDRRMFVTRQMRDLLGQSAAFVAVISTDFDHASTLLEKSDIPMRGSDALHLAIADRSKATLFTLDRRMADAGAALGLDARLLA